MVTGCSNIAAHDITLVSLPGSSFSANPPNPCVGETVTFIPGPTLGLITEEIWDYHDGTPNDHFYFGGNCCPATPTHVFTSAGPYHVTRTINPADSSHSSSDVYGEVFPVPVAQYTWFSDAAQTWPETACANQEVYFKDESVYGSSPTGAVHQWHWDFGDPGSGPVNNTSTLQNPVHIFSAAGQDYNVTLTVWDDRNHCKSVPLTRVVHVNPVIPADFTFDQYNCIGNPVTFIPNPAIIAANYTWEWDFGDGSPLLNTPGQVSHLFPAVGNWTVRLMLTSQFGCFNSSAHTVTTLPLPVAGFIFTTTGCENDTIHFTDQSHNPPNYPDIIVSRDWDFGDGSPHDTTQNPSHFYPVYNAAGYTVTLTVMNSHGCQAAKNQLVQMMRAPVASFQVQPQTASCASQSVQFNDLSAENGGGAIVSWLWDFDDISSGVSNYSTSQNPVHTYSNATTYQVRLTVTNANGCSSNFTLPVIINAFPAADFAVSSSCEGSIASFTNTSATPSGSTINTSYWEFGDGGTSSLPDPQHTYTAAGIYTVTLTITNSNGCINTKQRQVTVYPKPEPEFSYTGNCIGSPVSFTDHTTLPGGLTGHISRWEWNFGDGSVTPPIDWPAVPDIVHTFAGTATTHLVWLKTTSSNGCTDSISHLVTSSIAPTASFTSTGAGCIDQAVQFTDQSADNGGTSIQSWTWNFDDPLSGAANISGLKDPVHSFAASGPHTVTLTVTNINGCSDSYTLPLPLVIHDKPVPDFTWSGGCEGGLTQFTDASVSNAISIISYNWNFGDGFTATGPSPVHSFGTTGIHMVTLTVVNSNGCTETASKPLLINPAPVALFTYPDAVCTGNPVSFTDNSYVPVVSGTTSYIRTWQWDFGDGSGVTTITFPASPDIVHTFSGPATSHIVRLTVTTTENCTAFVEKTVVSTPAPVAAFSWSSAACQSEPAQFTDHSQLNGGGNIISWSWNFGDPGSGSGNTSTEPNPIHVFNTPGNYAITLIVTNAGGCTSTYTSPAALIIHPKPIAGFTANSTCVGNETVFTSVSVPNSPAIIAWNWSYGDGYTGTVSDPVHTYASAGVYNVTLTVTNSYGCTNDTTQTIQIYPKPDPAFITNAPACVSDSVHYTDMSATQHGYVTSWSWDFGDGFSSGTITSAAAANVSHKYANGGDYPVKLTISTSDLCTAEKTIPVQVQFAPVADFTHSAALCGLLPVQFHDNSILNGGGTLSGWSWNFGDPTSGASNTSVEQDPAHVFVTYGSKIITLVVTNINGCRDSIQKTIFISQEPLASFTAEGSCIGSPAGFTDNSTSPTGQIIAWSWDFGDAASGPNNLSSQQNPTHIYSAAGIYSVRLLVTNAGGCTRDTLIPVTVKPKPVALFQAPSSCAGDSLQFADLSVAPNSVINSWSWDFGDGSGTSTIQNPRYLYAHAGTYNVKLIVRNQDNCVDSIILPVVAHQRPTAAYDHVSYYCPAGQVSFQDISTGSGSVITERLWTFEQGATSSLVNPTHVFPVTDTNYMVSLIVSNGFGCLDTIVDSIFVKPAFALAYTNDTVCFNEPTHFQADNLAEGDSLYNLTWNFGDPGSGTANTSHNYNPTHTFSKPGLFIVKLNAFNSNNCADSIYHEVRVYDGPVPEFAVVSQACDSVILFNDLSTTTAGSITSWEWTFGDGSPVLTITAPGSGSTSHLYVNQGVYAATLKVFTSNGCSGITTKTVERTSCVTAAFSGDSLLCAGSVVNFTDQSQPVSRIDTWHWFFGDGSDTTYTAQAGSIRHTYSSGGTYPVSLIVTATVNGNTYTDTTNRTITIRVSPIPLFTYSGVCLKQPTLFTDVSVSNDEQITTWQWSFGDPGTGMNNYASGSDPKHTYDSAGIYSVRLIVKNKAGCLDSITKQTRIHALPVAQFTHEPACTGNYTLFHDRSAPSDTAINYWSWNFGDPSTKKDTSHFADPAYTYKKAGQYTARMLVRDMNGCSDTVDSTLTVHVSPVSAFTITGGYDGMTGRLLMNNQSTGADAYEWIFGNGQTSDQENPVVTYTTDGTYIITLVSTNNFQCADTTFYKYEFLFHGLFVPNAFAPESGVTGVTGFKAVGINLAKFHIEVYDSWGHLLWSSDDLDSDGRPTGSWDGRDPQGDLLPAGTYLWKINATFIDGTPWTGSDSGTGNNGTFGTVNLIR